MLLPGLGKKTDERIECACASVVGRYLTVVALSGGKTLHERAPCSEEGRVRSAVRRSEICGGRENLGFGA